MKAMTDLLALADINATSDVVGGKGATLARLARAHLPVPNGFHVTTAAYHQFIVENDLTTRLATALAQLDASRPMTFETVAQTISDLFARAPMPRALAHAIDEAYRALGHDVAVAVRSSATAEDLAERSFAGQYETFLNVRGVEAVQTAVKRCWASLWNARALRYRAQQHIEPRALAIAVLVQEMIPAQVAGVLFTAHPVTGARDCVVINATWGLGDALVSGLVTPDTFVVEKVSGRIIEREIVEKTMMRVCGEEGIVEQSVPLAQQRAPALDDAHIVELTRLGVHIEQLAGMPMDVEWTLAHNRWAIVQARPITTLR